jgi:NAD-dependent DNA ligase
MAKFPEGTTFVFVGKLATMTREQARALALSQGGVCPSGVTPNLDYLVIGDEDSPIYGMGDKKSKQLKAESLIDAGAPTVILTEEEFLALLGDSTEALAANDV